MKPRTSAESSSSSSSSSHVHHALTASSGHSRDTLTSHSAGVLAIHSPEVLATGALASHSPEVLATGVVASHSPEVLGAGHARVALAIRSPAWIAATREAIERTQFEDKFDYVTFMRVSGETYTPRSVEKHPTEPLWVVYAGHESKAFLWNSKENTIVKSKTLSLINVCSLHFATPSLIKPDNDFWFLDYELNEYLAPPSLSSDDGGLVCLSFESSRFLMIDKNNKILANIQILLEKGKVKEKRLDTMPFSELDKGLICSFESLKESFYFDVRAVRVSHNEVLILIHMNAHVKRRFLRHCTVTETGRLMLTDGFSIITPVHPNLPEIVQANLLADGRLAILSADGSLRTHFLEYFIQQTSPIHWARIASSVAPFIFKFGKVNDVNLIVHKSLPLPLSVVSIFNPSSFKPNTPIKEAVIDLETDTFIAGSERDSFVGRMVAEPPIYPTHPAVITCPVGERTSLTLGPRTFVTESEEKELEADHRIQCLTEMKNVPTLKTFPPGLLPLIGSYVSLFTPGTHLTSKTEDGTSVSELNGQKTEPSCRMKFL